ncbi:MAG TPA: class IV adenylate cyclase [Planctomycetaceae bacterium]|nr:class IV adenylate cyclase [Planctomycetaceae bacterium]
MTDAGPRALFEVELKFRVTEPDRLRSRLDDLGATWGEPVPQCDRYFAHPSRDFAVTDEALRLRTVGDANVLTYKGLEIDTVTKTRREIEVPLAGGPDHAAGLTDLLIALGFRPVREVAKTRRSGQLSWQGRMVDWTWDDVPPLGAFVELEIVTDSAGRAVAQDVIVSLAKQLGLTNSERQSYLELLMEHDCSHRSQ